MKNVSRFNLIHYIKNFILFGVVNSLECRGIHLEIFLQMYKFQYENVLRNDFRKFWII